MSHNRPRRVAELVHGELARIFREEISDPRLMAISITSVWMTADLRAARVMVAPMGGRGDREQIVAALEKARGYLRRNLGRGLRLRHVPDLQFMIDDDLDKAISMTALLQRMESGELNEE